MSAGEVVQRLRQLARLFAQPPRTPTAAAHLGNCAKELHHLVLRCDLESCDTKEELLR